MNKVINYTLLAILLLFLTLAYGRYPTYPLSGEIKAITISFYQGTQKNTFEVTSLSEIQLIQEACGLVWTDVIPSGSSEGDREWRLEIYYWNGDFRLIYLDDDEFDRSYYGHSEFIEFLVEHYSQ